MPIQRDLVFVPTLYFQIGKLTFKISYRTQIFFQKKSQNIVRKRPYGRPAWGVLSVCICVVPRRTVLCVCFNRIYTLLHHNPHIPLKGL